MRLSINLRRDLARLSDADLAQRLEQIWDAYEKAQADALPHRLLISLRGPIRHPLAYPFLSWVAIRWPPLWSIAFMLSIENMLGGRWRAILRTHLALCEARDINDELQRRVTRKARQAWQ